jgi:hypothetical protein
MAKLIRRRSELIFCTPKLTRMSARGDDRYQGGDLQIHGKRMTADRRLGPRGGVVTPGRRRHPTGESDLRFRIPYVHHILTLTGSGDLERKSPGSAYR